MDTNLRIIFTGLFRVPIAAGGNWRAFIQESLSFHWMCLPTILPRRAGGFTNMSFLLDVPLLQRKRTLFLQHRNSHNAWLTSTVGHTVQDVTFVAVALETSRWVHTCVVTCPVEWTLIYICRNRKHKHFYSYENYWLHTVVWKTSSHDEQHHVALHLTSAISVESPIRS